MQALETGLYTYLAHPDLINFTGSETFYRREMERLCLAAKELNIPLELNLLGLRANRTYPSKMELLTRRMSKHLQVRSMTKHVG